MIQSQILHVNRLDTYKHILTLQSNFDLRESFSSIYSTIPASPLWCMCVKIKRISMWWWFNLFSIFHVDVLISQKRSFETVCCALHPFSPQFLMFSLFLFCFLHRLGRYIYRNKVRSNSQQASYWVNWFIKCGHQNVK